MLITVAIWLLAVGDMTRHCFKVVGLIFPNRWPFKTH
jgi:hypothetical protein